MLERSKMAAPKARPGFYDDRFRNRPALPALLAVRSAPRNRCQKPITIAYRGSALHACQPIIHHPSTNCSVRYTRTHTHARASLEYQFSVSLRSDFSSLFFFFHRRNNDNFTRHYVTGSGEKTVLFPPLPFPLLFFLSTFFFLRR